MATFERSTLAASGLRVSFVRWLPCPGHRVPAAKIRRGWKQDREGAGLVPGASGANVALWLRSPPEVRPGVIGPANFPIVTGCRRAPTDNARPNIIRDVTSVRACYECRAGAR